MNASLIKNTLLYSLFSSSLIPELQTIMMERVAHPGRAQPVRRQPLVILTIMNCKAFSHVGICLFNLKVVNYPIIILRGNISYWEPDDVILNPMLITLEFR